MVTKLDFLLAVDGVGSVLAKILMVTKHLKIHFVALSCSVLAKILMVTKP